MTKIICDWCRIDVDTQEYHNTRVYSYSDSDRTFETAGHFCPKCRKKVIKKINSLFNQRGAK